MTASQQDLKDWANDLLAGAGVQWRVTDDDPPLTWDDLKALAGLCLMKKITDSY